MFTEILKIFQTNFPDDLKINSLFQRHIEIDADEHGPMAMNDYRTLRRR
jgi:hypothetical protein